RPGRPPEKAGAVPGEPRPAREAHDGKEADIDPARRPADGAGSAEQHDGEEDDPHRRAEDECAHEIGRKSGDGGHGPLETADRGFMMTLAAVPRLASPRIFRLGIDW